MAGLDFAALETTVRQRALLLAARALERRFNADRTDEAGPTLRCDCGKIARFAGRRRKRFETVLEGFWQRHAA